MLPCAGPYCMPAATTLDQARDQMAVLVSFIMVRCIKYQPEANLKHSMLHKVWPDIVWCCLVLCDVVAWSAAKYCPTLVTNQL